MKKQNRGATDPLAVRIVVRPTDAEMLRRIGAVVPYDEPNVSHGDTPAIRVPGAALELSLDAESAPDLVARLVEALDAEVWLFPRDVARPKYEVDRYADRLAVHTGRHIRPYRVADIDYIKSVGPYSEIHGRGERHLLRESLTRLEERLDPRDFLRVHRSAIVRLDRVLSFRREDGGAGEVTLTGSTKLRVSRDRRAALEQWLGVRG